MPEQLIASGLAWLIVAALFTIDIVIAAKRHAVPWEAAFGLGIGALMMGVAGAIVATDALAHVDLPDIWLWFVIVTRAIAMSIFVGIFMRLTLRPRWLIRLVDRWV